VSIKDSATSQSTSTQAVNLTYEQQQGKILYTKYCSVCHGEQGKGDGFNAYNLDPKPRDFTDPRAMAGIDDATLLATITEGGKGVNKSPLMPAWGGRMNKMEIEYVIEYVKDVERQH
jgi:mono/diheme cytochrome c family protein